MTYLEVVYVCMVYAVFGILCSERFLEEGCSVCLIWVDGCGEGEGGEDGGL